MTDDRKILEDILPAVIVAGEAILEIRARGLSVEKKADASPVTAADRAAEAIILDRLAIVAPDLPVVAEEACALGYVPEVTGAFFLVDALDGTKEFVRGGDDFTVNVALVRDGAPALGVVYAPVTGEMFAGMAGEGAWRAVATGGRLGERRSVTVRQAAERVDVVASKSHRTPETDAYISRYRVGRLVSAGSSLKFCMLAEGRADLYPRMGPTMQWDTAAGDAVLRAAGGRTLTLEGDPLSYGPGAAHGVEAYRNPWFVALGRLQPR